MPIQEADKRFRCAVEELPRAMQESLTELVSLGPVQLDGREITKTILLRLRSFYLAQYGINSLLGKSKVGAGVDFFVETILFYLKALNQTHLLGLEIVSERAIERKRGAIYPDISIWRDNEVLAIVECKTQLGWRRDHWQVDFEAREQRLKVSFPRAQAFLLVMTAENWHGFGQDPRLGKQFFALSKLWPTKLSTSSLEPDIITPVELLFAQIVRLTATQAALHQS